MTQTPRPDGDPAALLASWLADDATRPIITYRGPAGVRIELSAATAANAVAKAVNYLTDELLAEPGDAVLLDLPLHWQAPVLALGCWAAGLSLALPGADCDPVATLGTGERAAGGEPLAVSLHPWGMPLGGATPDGWSDFAAEVRSQPDRAPLRWPAAGEVWLRSAERPWTGEELVSLARSVLDESSARPGGRLATTAAPETAAGVAAMTVAPALAKGSVVLADRVDVTEISAQERSQGLFPPV